MKASLALFAAVALLAGCHADRNPAASSTAASPAKADKALEKSRDAMLGQALGADNQHWASTPAAASTAATPASATQPTGATGTTTPSNKPTGTETGGS